MKATNRIMMTATLGLAASGFAGTNGWDKLVGIFDSTNNAAIPMLDVRTRYEYGDQDGLEKSNAGTVRARIGLQSQDYSGFSGLVEFEATRAIDTQGYNALVMGDPAKTAVVDPENTELNRISLQYKKGDHQAVVGRQRLIINNARYVGNVGWRQNEQTYDAAYYKNTTVDGLTAEYAYIETVQRITGSKAAYDARKWDSNSHVLNLKYGGIEGHTFSAYAYLLDFENSVANSSDTVGANYAFKGTVADDYTLNAYAELAYQKDAADNPADYDALYLHLTADVSRDGWSGFAGYELLGSDDGAGSFRTPLATGHKFNGWNDQFLVTPANGLNDFYAGVGIPVPKVPMKVIYHHFWADNGSATYGDEIDYLAVHKINPKTKAIAKASYFIADSSAYADRFRFSIEMNYTY
ncbi:hypothetical protein [Pontiella sp.]|uniref:hypothetical protein n=1 Tax=Pontiella sp. TaxID=2837462 RepID=UPI003567434F